MTEHNWAELAEELGIRGRQNGEQLNARCPLHSDRTPSFSMNVQSGLFICHAGCGSGNFYKLVSLVMGVSLTSAMDWVLENRSGSPQSEPPQQKQSGPPAWRLYYEAAATRELPKWWFDRGLDWVDAIHWGVRWDVLRQQLLIPVLWEGELVGTIARNLRSGPKYVNSPALPKSEILFGLPQPLPERRILVVEGACDVFMCHRAGVAAVALLGLTMSDRQMALLEACEEIVLALDNDEPGQAAQEAIAARWQRPPRQLTRLTMPPRRKDAGECSADELATAVSERSIAAQKG